MDQQFSNDIDRVLETGANRGETAFVESDRFSAEPDEQYEQYDDTPDAMARIYAREQAAEREASVAHDAQLDREIKRIQEAGVCCNDGTHFDERGVLETMLELGKPYNIDRAWKAWHERTLGWGANKSKAQKGVDPKIDPQSPYETADALESIAALKKKYAVKREPHRGRIEDDPRLDMLLDRALSR